MRLKGHKLITHYYQLPDEQGLHGFCRAKCECGAYSTCPITTKDGRSWHRQHKQLVVASAIEKEATDAG